MFTRELVQAISDWQRGGDAKQKLRRGTILKTEAQKLPERFRQCDDVCYRLLSLPKDSFWQLADEFELPESISAWTVKPQVARQLKGGVPYPGQQGIIFAICPRQDAVLLNLHCLFGDPDFRAAARRHADIIGFYDGIGRYWDEQSEVVLEITRISLEDIFELGGFSSDRDELIRKCFGPNPTPEQVAHFDRQLDEAGEAIGPAWLGEAAKGRVIDKLKAVMPALRTLRKLQENSPP
jgi:hypothetical protein